MTPDERSILQSFLADLSRTPNVTKDPEADAMIADAVRKNPDAVYLLVQHAILADQALHTAQAQLAGQGPGFLSPQPQPHYAPPPPQYAPGYASPQYSSPWAGQGGAPIQSSPFAADSGLGGFLRGAGQMAVGVAAGDFLFQGIENIFSPRW